ncbi:hypothetical protein GGF50DRAFT_116451 [Schizophyllum commune]
MHVITRPSSVEAYVVAPSPASPERGGFWDSRTCSNQPAQTTACVALRPPTPTGGGDASPGVQLACVEDSRTARASCSRPEYTRCTSPALSGLRAICDEREDEHPEHHTQGAIGLVPGPLRAPAQAGALPARFEGIVRRKRPGAPEPSGFAGARARRAAQVPARRKPTGTTGQRKATRIPW